MKRWLAIIGVVAGLGGCGGDKKAAPEPQACEVDDDCPAGQVCSDEGACIQRRGPAPPARSNNPTPDKVKREAEDRVRRGTERRDDAIETLDP